MFRRDTFELPIHAIREMIANAVAHRSYLDDSTIQVSIYDDRVEVSSPGMLYGGLDLETAKTGKSRCRNAAIAESFHYMHIMETWGTGIPRIISKCKEYGLKEPLFEEFGDGLKVTLFRKVINGVIKVSNTVENISNGLSELSNTLKKAGNGVQKKGNEFAVYLVACEKAEITPKFISNIEIVFRKTGTEQIFSQGDIQVWLTCSKSKATNIMNAMKKAEIVTKVKGFGPGKYKFVN